VKRTLVPELLDSLRPEDPNAAASRRDLRIFNSVMGNHRWLIRTVAANVGPGERVLEIGAGSGELGLRLKRCGFDLAGLDLWPSSGGWPEGAGWHQADVRLFDRWAEYPVVIGSLIFHHFDPPALAVIGAALKTHARVILASEPVRARIFQRLFALLCGAIRASPVSRHDGHVSIGAGFLGNELPEMLGLSRNEWNWSVRTHWLGAYRLIAIRKS